MNNTSTKNTMSILATVFIVAGYDMLKTENTFGIVLFVCGVVIYLLKAYIPQQREEKAKKVWK